GTRSADAGPAHKLRSRQVERIPHDIDEKALGVIGKGFDAAVDRHRAHSRSPRFWRMDFCGGWLRLQGGNGAGHQGSHHDFKIREEGNGRLTGKISNHKRRLRIPAMAIRPVSSDTPPETSASRFRPPARSVLPTAPAPPER